MSSDLQNAMRIGSLLVTVGLLSESDLAEAAQLAVELGLPLGKVLVMSGFLTDEHLQAVIQVQSMLKDQLVSVDKATDAVQIVIQKGLTLQDALKEAGWIQRDLLPANKLGELLLEAGLLSAEDLQAALAHAAQSGLQLGRVLSLTKKLTEPVLCSSLNAQILLRDGKISREQAIHGLRAAHQRQMTVEQALIDQGAFRPSPKAKVKLGEMFVLAGILNEDIIMDAIEGGLVNDQPIGQVLVKSGHINMNMLAACLKLQEMVDNGTLTPIGSADVLRQVQSRGIPVAQAVAELGFQKMATSANVSLGDLLKLAGVLTEDDIQDAIRQSMQNSTLLGKILSITGIVDEDMVNSGLRCQALLKQGFLQQDQAIIALNYCQRMNRSLDEALIELGWTVQTRTAGDRTIAEFTPRV